MASAALPGVRSMPAPRLKRRSWSVSMGEDGLLEGCPGPSEVSTSLSPSSSRIQMRLLNDIDVARPWELRLPS